MFTHVNIILTLFVPHTHPIIIAMLTRTFGRKKRYWKKKLTYLKLIYSKWSQNVDNVGYIGKYVSKYALILIREHAVTSHQCASRIKRVKCVILYRRTPNHVNIIALNHNCLELSLF